MSTLFAALLSVAASSALAQALTQVELEQTYLDPGGRGSLLVGNGQTLQGGGFRVSAALQYSQGQLQSKSETGELSTLLRDRLALHLLGAVGITDWLELGADLPVIVTQSSETMQFQPNASGLGTPFLQAKVAILDRRHPLAVWAAAGLGLPVGTSGALGNGGLAFIPRINAGRNFDHFQAGAELGVLIRPLAALTEFGGSKTDRLGSQLYVSATATGVGDGVRGEVSLRGFLSLANGPAGLELLTGVRYPVKDVELFLVMGPGLGGTPTTPNFRLYAGAAFGNAGAPRGRCDERYDYVLSDCPDLDLDHDGVPNGVDLAPTEPEDKDGFQDEDGKPDPDNDLDGVLDADDKCPNERGPKENFGCPDLDTDGDGIVDRLDLAPNEPEDKDGFEDDDGKPDPDNDGDGILDVDDACPNLAGVAEEKGCPARDDDHDGTPNHFDNCPLIAGPAENQGCPLADKQLVVVTREKLKILEKVFFDTGLSTIQKRSNVLLDQLAAILLDKTFLKLVRVEGHTDNVGKPEKNLKLSADRAKAVTAYLVKKGVAVERLTPVGVGQNQPVEPNDTPAGREANRRVEFSILEQE